MTSKEDIALQLTKTIIENSTLAKMPDPAHIIYNIYNEIYNNIEVHRQ
jgi:hypothetical protein|nr:MAG TPA: hypothetical protein [Caudoviricetes sp.]DAL47099.1 MAG TPA_asm: hypothetical protein [Bacteriophage sp.]DAZ39643.1 MAG TPA: hypothetical protein [Caudoviricetes sp.]